MPVGAVALWKKKGRGRWGGSPQNVCLCSDCDMAGVGHLELRDCTVTVQSQCVLTPCLAV